MRALLRAGLALLELVVAVAIVAVLALILLNAYVKKPALDAETQGALQEQNIDTTNYKTTLDSVRSKLQNIQKERPGAPDLE